MQIANSIRKEDVMTSKFDRRSVLGWAATVAGVGISAISATPTGAQANGRRVTVSGWVAPPLKPDLDFFVLTRRRLGVCPFCSSSADWPEDIILVTLTDFSYRNSGEPVPVTVTGLLEVGEATDETTGFFSLLRLRAERVDEYRLA
ncbi:MAG: hypothetical protein EBT22_02805 [Chloroflexi bacterium]|nr:hypothetical protein [Chloroflexota bacterium]